MSKIFILTNLFNLRRISNVIKFEKSETKLSQFSKTMGLNFVNVKNFRELDFIFFKFGNEAIFLIHEEIFLQ